MSMNLIFTTSQNKYKYAERYNNYCKCETIWTISVTIAWINTIQQYNNHATILFNNTVVMIILMELLQSPKKVGDDIAKGSAGWKGMKVTVKLSIQNRAYTVEVVPSASALVIKALAEPPRDRKKEKNSM